MLVTAVVGYIAWIPDKSSSAPLKRAADNLITCLYRPALSLKLVLCSLRHIPVEGMLPLASGTY